MKKLLLTLATVFLAITASAETATWNFKIGKNSFKSGMTLKTATSTKGTWTFTYPENTFTQNDGSYGPIFGTIDSPVTSAKLSLSGSDIPQNATITDVTFTVKGNAKASASSWNLLIGGVKVGETKATTAGAVVSNLTWSNLNVAFGDISFELTKNAAGFHLQGVSITYTTGTQKEDAGLAFPKKSYSVNLGETFNAPILTNQKNVTVVYSSKIPAVATVDADGKVTIKGTGETVITAAVPESDEKYKGSASYTLTVIDPNAPASTEYTILFGPAYNSKGVNNYSSEFNVKVNNEDFAVIKNFNNNDNGWDFVRSGSKSAAAATTATITTINPLPIFVSDIVINAKKNKSGTNDKVTSAKIYISESKDFAVSKEIDITSYINGLSTKNTSDVKVTIATPANKMYYKIEFVQPKNTNNGWLETHSVKFIPVPAKEPVVSHDKNQVTITHEEKGAKIYYTVDGSDVDVTKATLYGGPFAITETTTVKAVAVVEGKANSAQHDYVAEYIAAPTATWESKNTTVEHHQSGVLDASTMDLDGIHGGIIITITAPEGCALWYSLTQGESNSITKAPAMYANVDNDFESKGIDLKKVDSGKATDILVQKQGKLTYYSENAKGIQSHDVVVNFTGQTGVEDIIADENNGEVEFFNLQGVRVANPENGVYIRRQGNKATKVLVK